LRRRATASSRAIADSPIDELVYFENALLRITVVEALRLSQQNRRWMRINEID
jgi:hypothetical protein